MSRTAEPVHAASIAAFSQEDPLFAQFLVETKRVIVIDEQKVGQNGSSKI